MAFPFNSNATGLAVPDRALGGRLLADETGTQNRQGEIVPKFSVHWYRHRSNASAVRTRQFALEGNELGQTLSFKGIDEVTLAQFSLN
jgi:hypothetical protein